MVLQLSLLLLISLVGQLQANIEKKDSRTSLHLLNILPFPDDQPNSGWDRAFELIPAAQLAVDLINNASNILPGYKLSLINVDSESCGIILINKGLANTFAGVFDPNLSLNVVGLTGLFCSSVTNVISPIFSFPDVTYLQLAGSTTSVHRNTTRHPYLVHSISSTTVFNDAVFAMMRRFNWQRISIIHDALGIFFKSNAANFVKFAANISEFNVTVTIPVSVNTISQLVHPTLIKVGARIVYISATHSEGVRLLCAAYKNQALYPGYVYIFHDRSIHELLSRANSTDCTRQQLLEALEGVFLLEYNLVVEEETKLISNLTYGEYYDEYISRLTEIESSRNMTLDRNNLYANVMHDQIWAFALSLSSSLQTIKARNITLDKLQLQQSQLLASILRRSFLGVSFQGASGFIKFTSNYEESSAVKIFQVINSTEELVGVYNPDMNDSLCFLKDVNPPPDRFENRPHLLPKWQFILFTVIILLWVVVTALILVFFLVFRNRPEVKASSPYLNLVIFVSCYFVFIATLVRNVRRGYQNTDFTATLICNMEIWLVVIGIILILSVLLMRLLRIRQIFRAYGKVGKYWKDKYLMMWILLICSGGIAILLIWTIVDKIQRVTTIVYQPSAIPPYFESHSDCSYDKLNVWVIILLVYIGILMVFVLFMAVQTRKIRISRFKHTKQINAFIFVMCITLCLLLPLWYVIAVVNDQDVAGHFIISSAYLSIAVYCQLFLFLPQIFAMLHKKRNPKKRRESQFSNAAAYNFSNALYKHQS